LGQQATAQEHGNLVDIARVVLGFATMERWHGERVPEDTRPLCAGTEVSQPIPGEETGDTDDQILPVGGNGLEKRCWASWQVPVDKQLALLVQDTERHGAGVQSDAAVQWVWFRVEAPAVSSSLDSAFSHSQHTTGVG
jgi:hypothetical protein